MIQQVFDQFGKDLGMVKQSGTWYRTTDDVTQAINLQKSQYGPSYYVNVGWWLRQLGDVTFPKDHQWHVGVRLDLLAPARAEEAKQLLDLESPIAEGERGQRLRQLLELELRPVLDSAASIEGLRLLRRESRLRGAAVKGPAVAVLNQTATPG